VSPRYAENYREPWQRGLHHYGGTAVRGLTRKGPRLPFADRSLFWFSANDNEAAINSAGEVTTLPNRGSLGGSVVPASGNGPEVVLLSNGKRGCNTTTNGGLQYASTTALQTLHDPTSNALVSMRIRIDDPAVDARLLMTRNPTAGSRGTWLQISGSDVRLVMGNGTTDTLSLSGGTDLVPGWYTIQFRKTALSFEIFLNGSAYLSGSAPSLTSGAQDTAVQIGSGLTDSARLAGIFAECAVHTGTFTNGEMTEIRRYLEDEWGGTSFIPRYSTCVFHFQADHPSTTIAYGASSTFSSAPNLGSLGGSLVPGTGLGPERIQIAGRFAALTTTLGSLMFGTTSSLTMLHDLGTSATLALHVRVDVAVPASNKRLFATRGVAATARGIIVYHLNNGALQISVSDGASNVVTINGAAITTGLHSIIVTKSAMVYTAYLDGSVYGSATAATLTTGASDAVASIGSTTADTTNFDGAILEAFVLSGAALTAGEVTQTNNYATARLAA